MDSDKTVQAHFVPEAAAQMLVTNAAPSLGLYTRDQLQGLALGRPMLAKDPSTGKMILSLGLKRSTDLLNWANLPIGAGDIGIQDGLLNIQITPQGNEAFYQLEGGGD